MAIAKMTAVRASPICSPVRAGYKLPRNIQLSREGPTMRVFLTGATGYIGNAVAERLRSAGHQLSALARSDAAAARLSAAGIEPIRGDFADP
jgi:hypothetical protein